MNFGDFVLVLIGEFWWFGPSYIYRGGESGSRTCPESPLQWKDEFKNQLRKNLINLEARFFSPEFESEISLDGEKISSDFISRRIDFQQIWANNPLARSQISPLSLAWLPWPGYLGLDTLDLATSAWPMVMLPWWQQICRWIQQALGELREGGRAPLSSF